MISYKSGIFIMKIHEAACSANNIAPLYSVAITELNTHHPDILYGMRLKNSRRRVVRTASPKQPVRSKTIYTVHSETLPPPRASLARTFSRLVNYLKINEHRVNYKRRRYGCARTTKRGWCSELEREREKKR